MFLTWEWLSDSLGQLFISNTQTDLEKTGGNNQTDIIYWLLYSAADLSLCVSWAHSNLTARRYDNNDDDTD